MQINETILIIYFLVAVNFLFNRLKDFSCHTQTWLTKNLIAKHLFNVAAIFFVIVLFTRSKPIHPIALIILTFVMYGFFMIITRCDHRFLAVFLISMVIVFLIEAYKSYYKEQETKQEIQEIQEKKEIQEIEKIKEPQIGLSRYPKLILNKNNKNNPIDINPNACEKNLVMDYDEVNLNSVKENIYDKLDKDTEQKEFNIFEENPKELKYVTTYINLPGYKGYNIEDTNRFELKKNNSGLINYVKLKDNETFKPHNSVIYP